MHNFSIYPPKQKKKNIQSSYRHCCNHCEIDGVDFTMIGYLKSVDCLLMPLYKIDDAASLFMHNRHFPSSYFAYALGFHYL